jgi:hypothetical protein
VLVGVYNTENNTVTLFPSLEDLVWLEFDSTQGKYTQGWEAKKTVLGTSTRGASISKEAVERYNGLIDLPRAVSIIGKHKDQYKTYSRPHSYLLEIMNESKNASKYRGFSVLSPKVDQKPKFVWNSITLNARSGLAFFKEMEKIYQDKIQKIILGWETPASYLDLSRQKKFV